MAVVNGNYNTQYTHYTHLSLAISKWFLDLDPTLLRSGKQGVTGVRGRGVVLGLLTEGGVAVEEGRFRDKGWGAINSSSLSTSISEWELSESISLVLVVRAFFLYGIKGLSTAAFDGREILDAFRADLR